MKHKIIFLISFLPFIFSGCGNDLKDSDLYIKTTNSVNVLTEREIAKNKLYAKKEEEKNYQEYQKILEQEKEIKKNKEKLEEISFLSKFDLKLLTNGNIRINIGEKTVEAYKFTICVNLNSGETNFSILCKSGIFKVEYSQILEDNIFELNRNILSRDIKINDNSMSLVNKIKDEDEDITETIIIKKTIIKNIETYQEPKLSPEEKKEIFRQKEQAKYDKEYERKMFKNGYRKDCYGKWYAPSSYQEPTSKIRTRGW